MTDARAQPETHAQIRTDPGDALLMDAVIAPHRSLDPRGFAILMGVLGVMSFACGMMFVSLGAWPVIGFFGLDVLLVYLAFKSNFLSGAARETVRITRREIHIAQHDARGRLKAEARLNPSWTRLLVSRDEDENVTRLGLRLHDRLYPLAADLSPPERTAFAAALKDSLGQARAA